MARPSTRAPPPIHSPARPGASGGTSGRARRGPAPPPPRCRARWRAVLPAARPLAAAPGPGRPRTARPRGIPAVRLAVLGQHRQQLGIIGRSLGTQPVARVIQRRRPRADDARSGAGSRPALTSLHDDHRSAPADQVISHARADHTPTDHNEPGARAHGYHPRPTSRPNHPSTVHTPGPPPAAEFHADAASAAHCSTLTTKSARPLLPPGPGPAGPHPSWWDRR